MKNDPRITRVGKIILKLSIDELPQLFNVLNGTMSLDGPRPPLPKELQNYEEWHFTRLDGMPGITGLWQVNRGPTPNFEEMVAYDLKYLRNWSLQKDLLIMLKTVPVVIAGRGAY
jgi:lipopolysaccharide/colanic/teichoic acid biosynthesis glycosyltransferase